MSYPSLVSIFVAAVLTFGAPHLGQRGSVETLQFRITTEYTEEQEGYCKGCKAVTKETWIVTVTPAGMRAESETVFSGYDQNREGNACQVGGVYRGRHEMTHLNWSMPPSEYEQRARLGRRLLHVKARVSTPGQQAETSGNCPAENHTHEVYAVLRDGLEQAVLDEWFVPTAPGSRTMRSIPEGDEPVYTLEVVQGDPYDLARYATLRNYITPLTAKP